MDGLKIEQSPFEWVCRLTQLECGPVSSATHEEYCSLVLKASEWVWQGEESECET